MRVDYTFSAVTKMPDFPPIGFITTENAISEDFGSVRADARKGKKSTKNKGKRAQKELHKTKYVFLHSSKRTKAYLDYFRAEPQVENRLLGLTNGVSTFLHHSSA